MTGRQIRRLREALNLDPFALAGVLGVHVSTIYRWEASPGDVRMDPLQAQIMAALRKRVTERPETASDLNQAIVKGLIAGGALVALLALLRNLLDED